MLPIDPTESPNSASLGRCKLRGYSVKTRYGGSNVNTLGLTIGMPDGRVAANHGKDLESTIIALDGQLADRCKRNAIPDMFGDDRVDQYLRVIRQTAKPGCQIDDVSDRRVVEASVIAEGSDGRGAHRDP